MKPKEIYEELIALAKNIGINIRRESGNFRSGYCVINNQEVIILNRSTPLEAMTSVLAACLARHHLEDIFIKPVVREYIEKEAENAIESNFNLEVKY